MERIPTHELRIRAIPSGYSFTFYLQREHLIPSPFDRYRSEWITIKSFRDESSAKKALEELNKQTVGYLKEIKK